MSISLSLNLITILVDESDVQFAVNFAVGWTDYKEALKELFRQVSKSSPDYQTFKLEDFTQKKDLIGDGNLFKLYYSTLIPKIAKRDDVLWRPISEVKDDVVKKAILNI